MDISKLLARDSFLVQVKPKSRETAVVGYDAARDTFLVAVKAPPTEGKANRELERYFTKLFKKPVKLKSGFTSKRKLFVVE